MPRVLLDTSAYLDLQRARKHLREAWAIHSLRHFASYNSSYGKPAISTLSVMEITAGFGIELRPAQMAAFLDSVLPMFEVVDFGAAEACLAGEIYSRLEASRLRIGIADTCIAAIAIYQSRTVITSNVKHFQRVIDAGYPLALSNWRVA